MRASKSILVRPIDLSAEPFLKRLASRGPARLGSFRRSNLLQKALLGFDMLKDFLSTKEAALR